MTRAGTLKVFRTPIGFHDAYVAAPSQKAALAAWGSDADLFARGVAELVTDDALMAEPLAKPGEIIRRSRGTAAEQIAEAAKAPPAPPKAKGRAKADREAAADRKPTVSRKQTRKPRPRPARTKLDAAEAAVADAEAAARTEDRRIAGEIASLTREREAQRASAEKNIARLDRARANAETSYKRAVAKWQDA